MSRAVATAEASGKGVVAVTGASGFIGSFICEALSNAGYLVRACVRDPTNEEKVAHLKKIHGLQLFKADLFDEGSFRAAFDGADAVIHTAAVVEIAKVKNAQREVVDPSVLGVKNVLKSLSPSVRTFVHTSSIAAVHRRQSDQLLTETDWNDWATIEVFEFPVLSSQECFIFFFRTIPTDLPRRRRKSSFGSGKSLILASAFESSIPPSFSVPSNAKPTPNPPLFFFAKVLFVFVWFLWLNNQASCVWEQSCSLHCIVCGRSRCCSCPHSRLGARRSVDSPIHRVL
jgi:hypothetical protein